MGVGGLRGGIDTDRGIPVTLLVHTILALGVAVVNTQVTASRYKVGNGLQLLMLGSVFLLVTWLQLYSATVDSTHVRPTRPFRRYEYSANLGSRHCAGPRTPVSFVGRFEK